jgi:hypothetical protein
MKIRKATAADASRFLEIKDQLSFRQVDGTTTKGGFLLGTDEATYQQYINKDYCLVAELDGLVVGFGIMLRDESVRASDIWLRRKSACWEIDIDTYENARIAYFEQLAFMKGYSRTVMKLAYRLLTTGFDGGHEYMFATTVNKPIVNLAAVPYILKASGRKVGNINEYYPLIGEINSDIYMIERNVFETTLKQSHLYAWLNEGR